ncbi:MAG: (Fe-S)-binding protein [Clostridiales bacterium]|nr:(Fe-S)-binding protein [Clostridiales bacterium]
MLKEAKRTPKKLTADVTVTINKIEQQTRRIANRLINACNQCGLCAEVCPAGIDIGGCLLEARKALFAQGGMPPAFHDYYLFDLCHAQSGEAYFHYYNFYQEMGTGVGPGAVAGPDRMQGYMFFPGCQSGASCPGYVLEPYKAIREAEPGCGILVSCCGAPAEWAGDEAQADGLLEEIRRVWDDAGCPTLICSCLNCMKRISEKLPDIPLVSFYEWIAGVSGPETAGDREPVYVFDPCAGRRDDGAGAAVRSLLDRGGYPYTAGPMSGRLAECCGYGGHIYASNPGLYDQIVDKRISGSELPYVVYCSNCRDAFAAQGKRCMHIFDILFGLGDGGRAAPRISERRENRRIMKQGLSALVLGKAKKPGGAAGAAGQSGLPQLVLVGEGLAEKMERAFMSCEEAQIIIALAESTGRKLYDKASGHYIAHGDTGVSTYWVEYRCGAEGEACLANMYTHRMHIEEEWIAALPKGRAPRNDEESSAAHSDEGSSAAHSGEESAEGIECCLCRAGLITKKTSFSYLAHNFSAEIPVCPVCGQVYVPEGLATGKIAEVESHLEEK